VLFAGTILRRGGRAAPPSLGENARWPLDPDGRWMLSFRNRLGWAD
jgi:hypothetical protein